MVLGLVGILLFSHLGFTKAGQVVIGVPENPEKTWLKAMVLDTRYEEELVNQMA